jgi:hypothetical protein
MPARPRLAQHAAAAAPSGPSRSLVTPAPANTMPSGMSSGSGDSDGTMEEGYPADGYGLGSYYGSEACADGCYASGYGGCSDVCNGGCDDGCCDTCGSDACGGGCLTRGGFGCNLFGWICPPDKYYFTADYIYARANFSEAIAYLEQDDQQQQGVGTDTFHSLDFAYESSYRFGGGYRLCDCNEEVRFMFTRLSSTANATAPSGSFLAYEVTAPPEGETLIHADVDLRTYDVDFAKTIQLGGSSCSDCCDPCGPRCAPWDLTWTGGFRFADANWDRTYTAVDEELGARTNAESVMDFRGGGVKVGLEGRRYFCDNGCFSVYMKGDISLLLGDVDLQAVRTTFDPTNSDQPNTLNTQTFSSRQIIPVTEIETGLTGHITCNSSITTGYMFSAWHDLGFRDEFAFPTLMETNYDDANILGFDGFFARLEVAF